MILILDKRISICPSYKKRTQETEMHPDKWHNIFYLPLPIIFHSQVDRETCRKKNKNLKCAENEFRK